MSYDIDEREKEKMIPSKRRFSLTPMEGKPTLSASGAVDKRLFTGEAKIYGEYNSDRGTWTLKYDGAAVPGGLQGEFTDFEKLANHTVNYFKGRNVEAKAID